MYIWRLSKKLSNFPEHLRMMFLHLWCIGLRISEVCTLKGDAYYRQKRRLLDENIPGQNEEL